MFNLRVDVHLLLSHLVILQITSLITLLLFDLERPNWATGVLLGISHVPIASSEGPSVPQFWGFHYVDTLCRKTQ